MIGGSSPARDDAMRMDPVPRGRKERPETTAGLGSDWTYVMKTLGLS
jgi:hypothetical protein